MTMTETKMLTDNEKLANRATRVAHVLSKVNTTLVGRDVPVKVMSGVHHQAPAWSDGNTVSINLDHLCMDDFTTPDGMVGVIGLDYHELAHLLYTPYDNYGFVMDVRRTSSRFNTWNLLEDQRIERLICGRWKAVRPYLAATIMRHIIAGSDKDATQMERLYPLLVGRAHVPANVRALARDRFIDQGVVDEIAGVVADYQTVVHPSDDKKASDLVTEMERLLSTVTLPDLGDHKSRPVPFIWNSTDKATEEQQRADGEAAQQQEDDDQEGEGGSGDDEGADGPVGSGQLSDGEANASAADVARHVLGKLVSDDEVSDTIADVSHQASHIKVPHAGALDVLQHQRSVDVPTDVMRAAREFSVEIGQLMDEAAPGWLRDQPSGKLNVQRAMHGGYEGIWDRWSPGHQDAFSIEAVLIGDMSSSMLGEAAFAACQGLWAVRRAIEMHHGEAVVTTLGYDSDRHVVLTPRGHMVDPTKFKQYHPQGSTRPSKVLTEARQIFAVSTRKHKVLFIMTDGEWDPEATSSATYVDSETSIQMMNDAGVVTCLVFITDMPQLVLRPDFKRHKCELVVPFTQPRDLVTVARTVVTDIMRRGA
jgi:hypothetical protein